MPLEPPKLDDRNFEEILAEAKLRLRRFCPEWTDFNDGDPGMALVQLFAWLTEQMLYKFNRVSERTYIQFLKQLNLELRAARPAQSHVALEMRETSDPQPQPVRARARFLVAGESGEPLTFETLQAIDLVPYKLDAVQVFDGLEYQDYSQLNESTAGVLPPLGRTPQRGNAIYLGFNPGRAAADAAFPTRLALRFFLPPTRLSNAADSDPLVSASRVPRLVWEFQSRLDDDRSDPDASLLRWRPLSVVEDGTRALTREGTVVLRGPGPDCLKRKSPKPIDDLERFWIRARLVDGAYPSESIPAIAFVRANVVEVENRATFAGEVVGVGDGTQTRFLLRMRPVDPDSLVLAIVGTDDQVVEKAVLKDDFYNSNENDLHYTLNANLGEIRFGNGKHGRIPAVGERLVALSYRAGGGAAGNVAAGRINAPPLGTSDIEKVTNPRPAAGGEDEETLEDLLERAPRILRGDNRAVTKGDYLRFAEEVPGVGRAAVLPQFLRRHPGISVPGAVTVVVIPREPRPNDDDPEGPLHFDPTTELLNAVARRLNEIRPAGTELSVVGPRPRLMELSVKIVPPAGVSDNQAREQVKKVLDRHFQPVEFPIPKPRLGAASAPCRVPPPQHWKIGASVFPSRLYEVIFKAVDEASGVSLVQDVVELTLKENGREVSLGDEVKLQVDELPRVRVSVVIDACRTGRRP
jgi:predicted phage baseplate assembly protein